MSLEKELDGCEVQIELPSDDDLALAAKGGDREARNTLYLRHFPAIMPMLTPAKRILASLAYFDSSLQPDDLTQQAFLIFCHLLDRWHGDSAHEPFLLYVARLLPSHAAHFVRDTLHVRRQSFESGNPLALTQHPEYPLDELIHTNMAWHEQIDTLDHQSKSLLTLRYSLGLSTAQIADLSSFSPRTIDRQLNAALHQLRHQLLSTWQDCA